MPLGEAGTGDAGLLGARSVVVDANVVVRVCDGGVLLSAFAGGVDGCVFMSACLCASACSPAPSRLPALQTLADGGGDGGKSLGGLG